MEADSASGRLLTGQLGRFTVLQGRYTCTGEIGFMRFDIRPDSPTPIYEQIISQIIFVIASGALETGTQFPSVRDLADQLTVNPNTVAKAYKSLAERGILEARRGLGMEVTEQASALCRAQRQDIVRHRIREALREAVASALSSDEVDRIVADELHRVNGHRK